MFLREKSYIRGLPRKNAMDAEHSYIFRYFSDAARLWADQPALREWFLYPSAHRLSCENGYSFYMCVPDPASGGRGYVHIVQYIIAFLPYKVKVLYENNVLRRGIFAPFFMPLPIVCKIDGNRLPPREVKTGQKARQDRENPCSPLTGAAARSIITAYLLCL